MNKASASNDPRVARTKQLLLDALVELTQHTRADCITVKQLTGAANINRVTFYRHFTGMADFLDQLTDDVFEYLQHPLEISVFRDYHAAIAYYTAFFESVKKYEGFFSSMLGQNGLPDFRQRFSSKRRTWHDSMVRTFRGEFDQNADSDLLAVTFIAVLLSLIEYWLHHGAGHASRYMAEQLVRLTHDRVLVTYQRAT